MRGMLPSSEPGIARLAAAVQFNCDLVDARHARDSGMCTYLLGMREYFRWATALGLGAPTDTQQVGTWIAAREQRWEALLEGCDDRLLPLPLGTGLDAYDDRGVNLLIDAQCLVYGAGIGRFGVPVFFLARRERPVMREGACVIVTDDELARGFVALPAVSRDGCILVRRDAFRRWLWTRAEAASARAPGDAFRMALDAYGGAGPMDAAIERMVHAETETLVLHELGELRAGRILGPDWECMLAQLADRRTEVVVRAVRDLLADCLVTLPALLERRAAPSVNFWFSNFDGMRRALAPGLYQDWASGSFDRERERAQATIAAAVAQWSGVARALLGRWRENGAAAVAALADGIHPAG